VRLDTNQALSAQDCWELLASQTVGRLAVSIKALPAILPVQYYIDDDLIAICLGHHQVPTRTVNHAVAAFAVDSLTNQPLSQGWTVQILGVVQPPQRIGALSQCRQPAAGQIVHMRPEVITGERIWLCPFL
jgi:hypothetical protein